MHIEWSWTDGWLLMVLLLAQEGETGAQIHTLIAAADATNHAIPAPRELASSLTKFIRCGLITVAEERFLLSPQYLPGVQKAYQRPGGLFAAGDKGLKWLNKSKLVWENAERLDFSEAQVKAAYDLYMSALHTK